MTLRNLSYRYKVPLSLTAVILLATVVVTATLLFRAYGEARNDLLQSAESLSRVLTKTLREALLHDDLWQAYEIVRTPLTAAGNANPLTGVVVLDARKRVYVSTDPAMHPVLSEISAKDAYIASLTTRAGHSASNTSVVGASSEGNQLSVATSIRAEDGTTLGFLVLTYNSALLWSRFAAGTFQVLLIAVGLLVLILPIAWVWGKRMDVPLGQLADSMERLGSESAEDIDFALVVRGADEIGTLTARFKMLLAQLREKEALERQMVSSERLAAVGRLAAGIAHEINNPLGGMINAVDTLERHGKKDPMTERTMGLVRRGLQQIRSIVGALLVEARLESHSLTVEDWEDIRTLVQSEILERRAHFVWNNSVTETLPLPAAQVRQLLLNLLLNAIQAVQEGGHIDCSIGTSGGQLTFRVSNDGAYIAPDKIDHLFEPFHMTTGAGKGHGLGLWVSYQIIQQLGGTIEVQSAPGNTEFFVALPVAGTLRNAA